MHSVSDWMTHCQGPVWRTPKTLPLYAPPECDSKTQYTLTSLSVLSWGFSTKTTIPSFHDVTYSLSFFLNHSSFVVHNFCSCSLHPVGSTQFIYVGTKIVMVAEKVWKRKFVWPWISNMGNWFLKNNCCLLMSPEQWHRMPLFLYIHKNLSAQKFDRNLNWEMMCIDDWQKKGHEVHTFHSSSRC